MSESDTAHIRLFGEVSSERVHRLIDTVERKLSEGMSRLVLLVSSPGGKVAAGISGYNFLKGIPAEVITYNFGNADSIAAVLYCAGAKRYCAPHGRFLLHGVVTNLQTGRYDEKVLRDRITSLESDRGVISRIIAETCGQPVERVEQDMLQGRMLTAQEALGYGLVHEIRAQIVEPGVQVIAVQ